MWLKDGRRHRLVWKEDVAKADDLFKASIADGHAPLATIIPNAELSMIVTITDDDCWLMADGAWRGPSEYARAFSDIKLTCTGAAPSYSYLLQDFNAAVANIEHFMKRSDTYGAKRVGLLVGMDGAKKIRFRHVPFVVRDFASTQVHHLTLLLPQPMARITGNPDHPDGPNDGDQDAGTSPRRIICAPQLTADLKTSSSI